MAKLWVALGLAGILAFGVVTWRKRASPEQPGGTAPDSADKQRIQAFWEQYRTANSLRLQGEMESAATAYRRCLQFDPGHEDSLYYLGLTLKELGEYGEAVSTLERLAKRNPASSRAYTELGATLALRAPGWTPDFDQARAAFLRSVEINREEAGPFLRLGLMELDQGHFPGALGRFRVAAGFGSPEGDFQAGYTLFLLGEYRAAAGHFCKALEAYTRERKIAARGVLSEGDVLPAAGRSLTAVEKAGLKSMLFLYWTARRLGRYPECVPKEFRVQEHLQSRPLFHLPGIRKNRCAHPGAIDCASGDYDGDGRPDRFVLYWRRPAQLYAAQPDGQFLDRTAASLGGLRVQGSSALFFDYDQDGLLDLLVTAHAPYEDVVRCLLQPDFRATRNTPRLFRNRGDGRLEEVTTQVGFTRCYGVMQAVAADLDSDGWPDLVFLNGSLDAQRLEPSLALQNVKGQRFREWFYLPASDDPRNFVGVGENGMPLENPVLRGRRR